MTHEDFHNEVRHLLGDEYAEACELYSFDNACDEGMTPQQAVDDYHEWINA